MKEERDTLPLGLDATWPDHLPTTVRTGSQYLDGGINSGSVLVVRVADQFLILLGMYYASDIFGTGG